MAAPTSLTSQPFINQQTGGVYLDNGNFVTDGNGGPTFGNASAEAGLTGAVQTLATGNTIAITAANGGQVGAVHVTAAAAVTGIILPVGTKPYQRLTVVHEGASANTITFAALGTSNVADGASDVITGPSARIFVWDTVAGTPAWYACH